MKKLPFRSHSLFILLLALALPAPWAPAGRPKPTKQEIERMSDYLHQQRYERDQLREQTNLIPWSVFSEGGSPLTHDKHASIYVSNTMNHLRAVLTLTPADAPSSVDARETSGTVRLLVCVKDGQWTIPLQPGNWRVGLVVGRPGDDQFRLRLPQRQVAVKRYGQYEINFDGSVERQYEDELKAMRKKSEAEKNKKAQEEGSDAPPATAEPAKDAPDKRKRGGWFAK